MVEPRTQSVRLDDWNEEAASGRVRPAPGFGATAEDVMLERDQLAVLVVVPDTDSLGQAVAPAEDCLREPHVDEPS